jgi:hypothetical protein
LTVQKTFNGTALLELIKELIRLDHHWIPQENGHSLYIRPVMSASIMCPDTFRVYSSVVLSSIAVQLEPKIPLGLHHLIQLFYLLSAALLAHTTRTDSSLCLCTAQQSTHAHSLEVSLEDESLRTGFLVDIVLIN